MKCLECNREIKEIEFMGAKQQFDPNYCQKCFYKNDPIVKKLKTIKLTVCFSCLAKRDKKTYVTNKKLKLYLRKLNAMSEKNDTDSKEYKEKIDFVNNHFLNEIESKILDVVDISTDYEVFDYAYDLEPVDFLSERKNNKTITGEIDVQVRAIKRDLFTNFIEKLGMKEKVKHPMELYNLLDNKNKAKFEKLLVSDSKIVNYEFNYDICPQCKKLYGNYFESILKLRYEVDKQRNIDNRDQFNDMLEYVRKLAKKQSQKIVKELEVDKGIDLYFTENAFLGYVVKKISHSYGIRATKSYTLYTLDKQRSKQVYRHTASIKVPHFKVGDYVEDLDKDTILLLMDVNEGLLKFKDILNRRYEKYDIEGNHNLIKADKDELFETKTLINVDPLEIFDEGYNEVKPVINKFKKKVGYGKKEIELLYYDTDFYLIPEEELVVEEKKKRF